MLRPIICALLVISALLIMPSAAVGTDEPYTITIENGEVNVPERTVSAAGQEFTVSSIAPITPGEEINYQISSSEDEPYRVVLYSDEKRIEAFNSKGDDPKFSTGNLDPGTYAMAIETEEIETIQPVVITSYETTVSAPSETDMGNAVSAEISIDEHTDVNGATLETVQVVIANGSINETHTAEQTADGEYVADFDVEYTPGEYRVYAVVRGNETVENGRANVIGMSEEQTLTITDSNNADGGSPSDGSQDGGGADDSAGNDTNPDGSNNTETSNGTDNSTSTDSSNTTDDSNGTDDSNNTDGSTSIDHSTSTDSESLNGTDTDSTGETSDDTSDSTDTDGNGSEKAISPNNGTVSSDGTEDGTPLYAVQLTLLSLVLGSGFLRLQRTNEE